MNLKRCPKEHFYDADKFETCPYCQAEEKDSGTIPVHTPENPKGDTGLPMDRGLNGPRNYLSYGQATDTTDIPQWPQSPGNSWEDEADPPTIAFPNGGFETDPVVGWLVCVKGKNYGKSYTIKCGRNFVGRGKDMDIQITGDETISRDRHAILLYEPKKREFIAQPGESRGLYYINDEVVLAPRKLQRYDLLSLGKTSLMFFPCCDEVFSWEDYSETDEKEEGREIEKGRGA